MAEKQLWTSCRLRLVVERIRYQHGSDTQHVGHMHHWWCAGQSRAPENNSRRCLARPNDCDWAVVMHLRFEDYGFGVSAHLVVLDFMYLASGCT